MVEIPSQVQELIDRFETQSELYRSPTYNETNLRIDFVNPMFKALGWDIDNTKGYAEAFREVVHEDAIRITGTIKSPDYSFRIGGRRIFFLEAKKPAVNIYTDVDAAYQLRRYAWTAGLPLSILTNFKEFAVYDCRVKPKFLEKASTARLWYFTHKDYPQKWDEIASVFSPDAIQHGAFDRYILSHKKSGTQEFDDAFLDEMEDWRKKLAGNLALRNDGKGGTLQLDQPGLNFSTQRIIDRIVFLRICEDRGIEPPFQLQALLSGDNVYARMRQLFTKADQRYNSGLFHFQKEKNRDEPPDELTLGLEIDDAALKYIIKRLYYPDSPYVFKEVRADILGSVYERFLGNIIHLTAGHHAKIEPKPEVRKAGGVYYTPTYIVNYIVQNTVGRILEGMTPTDAAELRVLDPACGSGSFLLGAYQHLLDWHHQWYLANDALKWSKGRNPTLRPGPRGDMILSIRERKRILTNNIYGVDVDPQAVEVTKLSVLLKCLEGESAQSINDLLLFHERALPDLGNNIQCGNSLISADFYTGETSKKLSEQERSRIRPFNWQEGFAKIMKSGGFDAVIGNPPYIDSEWMTTWLPNDRAYLSQHYQSAKGNWDIFCVFVDKALQLCKSGGMSSMIVPNKLGSANYASGARGIIAGNSLLSIRDYSRVPVFPVAVYPIVYVVQKGEPKPEQIVHYERMLLDAESRINVSEAHELSRDKHFADPTRPWAIFGSLGTNGVAQRLADSFPPLSSVAEVTGAATVAEAYEIQSLLKDVPRLGKNDLAVANSGTIDRYEVLWGREKLRYLGRSFLHPAVPAQATRKLPATRRKQALSPKLIVAGMTKRLECAPDLRGRMLAGKSTSIIISKVDLRYLLGLLNSRLVNYYFATTYGGNALQGGYLRIGPPQLKTIPIRTFDLGKKTDKSANDRLMALVDQMLSLHKSLASAQSPASKESVRRQIDSTDYQIDRLVYDLYDLSDEEIKIIDEAAGT
jgi:hypothetical protein